LSVAALHYNKFKEQAVKDGKVFTFTEGGAGLQYLMNRKEKQ
jgi:hypothetical protein